jgi:hypothetical protein
MDTGTCQSCLPVRFLKLAGRDKVLRSYDSIRGDLLQVSAALMFSDAAMDFLFGTTCHSVCVVTRIRGENYGKALEEFDLYFSRI